MSYKLLMNTSLDRRGWLRVLATGNPPPAGTTELLSEVITFADADNSPVAVLRPQTESGKVNHVLWPMTSNEPKTQQPDLLTEHA